MSQRILLIRLFESGGSEWGLFDSTGTALDGPSSGLPSPANAAGARVVVLAPGESVLLTVVTVPTRSPARLRRALPFAVEDRLASDVDELHVAAGPRGSGGRVSAAVVSRRQLESWLSALQDAGLEPDAVVPEPLALPLEDSGCTVLMEEGRVVVRLDGVRGWAGELELMEAVPADPDSAVTVYDASGGAGLPRGWRASRVEDPGPGGALGVMARGLADEVPNLLQGDYLPRRREGGVGRLWRVAAALLLGWGVLELGFAATDVWRLDRESERLETRIASVFTETFPGARVVDPRAQMAQRLEALVAGDSDALALIRSVAPVLQAADGLTLQSLEYRDGDLMLTLKAASLAELDRVQSQLAGRPGLRAELASAAATDQGVDGRLLVRRAGA